jgi:hypothetical protein
MACRGVPACQTVLSDPLTKISILVDYVKSSIMTWEYENPCGATAEPLASNIYYTDYRYHYQDPDRHLNYPKRSDRRNTKEP